MAPSPLEYEELNLATLHGDRQQRTQIS